MTRSNARELAIHYIFTLGFTHRSAQELLEDTFTPDRFEELREELPLYAAFPNEKQAAYIRSLVLGVFAHGPELDDYISRHSVGWSFSRIPRVAAAIMRTAMYEILYMPEIPNAAAINDAVEIAKGYEPQEVVSFLNGILGSFVRAEFREESRSARTPAPAEPDPDAGWEEPTEPGTPGAEPELDGEQEG